LTTGFTSTMGLAARLPNQLRGALEGLAEDDVPLATLACELGFVSNSHC